MPRLHHWRLDPFSRQARLALAEKGVRVALREERVWDGRQGFLALNPAGATPVFVEGAGAGRRIVVGARALIEYLEETRPDPALLPFGAVARAEARRLADWFDRKYDAEVNQALLFEGVEKRATGAGEPDAAVFTRVRDAVRPHTRYVSQLAASRGWLAGGAMSIADVAGAAHLSCADYFGLVDWDEHPPAKAWWRRMKARAAFAPLLADALPDAPPAPTYAALDF